MDTIEPLTRRGRQHREAIEACRTRYEGLPDSRLRETLLAAADKAIRGLHHESKYRTADAPLMPAIDRYIPGLFAPFRSSIPTHKPHDNNHIQATNPPVREPVIKIRIAKVQGVPGVAVKRQIP